MGKGEPMLTTNEKIGYNTNIAILKSIKERSKDGSIRLSTVDQNVLSNAIHLNREKLNGGE